MHDVVFDDEAIGFLNKLPTRVKERIFNRLMSSKENPFHFFERLTGRHDFKMRVGDYRIIADIDQATKKIEITHVGHRKNIYENI